MDLHNRTIRADVQELGSLLGEVISRHSPPEGFDAVERARTAAIASRSGETEDPTVLEQVTRTEGEEIPAVLARAFTIYFQLINLAEERERVRALRRGQEAESLSHSIASAIETLSETGTEAETVEAILEDVRVVPTFTAHPTEARRKTVKGILQRVGDLLADLDEQIGRAHV